MAEFCRGGDADDDDYDDEKERGGEGGRYERRDEMWVPLFSRGRRAPRPAGVSRFRGKVPAYQTEHIERNTTIWSKRFPDESKTSIGEGSPLSPGPMLSAFPSASIAVNPLFARCSFASRDWKAFSL